MHFSRTRAGSILYGQYAQSLLAYHTINDLPLTGTFITTFIPDGIQMNAHYLPATAKGQLPAEYYGYS